MAELLVVDTGQQAINFAPATVADEIEQNVRMIISTPKGTVALDRDFGIDYDLVDQPTPRAKAILDVEIVRQVGKYEPRAKVVKIEWPRSDRDVSEGVLAPIISIEVQA